ncbi:hypothetical protein GCM10008956_35240 [Deinococcus arenae]|uniref:Uncharacterized protein n=1 Tax=Deinococcus arenae TaxID=1452751 RepID=A0A8H9GY52_9DEIO|nr:hypothetical protein GCM10008956_35240 [Deinococcus arenae]
MTCICTTANFTVSGLMAHTLPDAPAGNGARWLQGGLQNRPRPVWVTGPARYSQPFSRAARAASTRFSAPSFPIASDR